MATFRLLKGRDNCRHCSVWWKPSKLGNTYDRLLGPPSSCAAAAVGDGAVLLQIFPTPCIAITTAPRPLLQRPHTASAPFFRFTTHLPLAPPSQNPLFLIFGSPGPNTDIPQTRTAFPLPFPAAFRSTGPAGEHTRSQPPCSVPVAPEPPWLTPFPSSNPAGAWPLCIDFPNPTCILGTTRFFPPSPAATSSCIVIAFRLTSFCVIDLFCLSGFSTSPASILLYLPAIQHLTSTYLEAPVSSLSLPSVLIPVVSLSSTCAVARNCYQLIPSIHSHSVFVSKSVAVSQPRLLFSSSRASAQ